MSLVSSCSCLCPIHCNQVLSREWRCSWSSWSSADRRCSNYIWVINNLIAYLAASYIRDLTVVSCRSTSIFDANRLHLCRSRAAEWGEGHRTPCCIARYAKWYYTFYTGWSELYNTATVCFFCQMSRPFWMIIRMLNTMVKICESSLSNCILEILLAINSLCSHHLTIW